MKITKKGIDFMKKMANEVYEKQFEYDGLYYIMNKYSVLRYTEPIKNIDIDKKDKLAKRCAEMFNMLTTEKNYMRYDLPDMRNGISNLVGRKLSTVIYSHDKKLPNINARYARDIMELLHVDFAYMQGKKDPVFFMSNDNITAGLLLPTCVGVCKEKEFWEYK